MLIPKNTKLAVAGAIVAAMLSSTALAATSITDNAKAAKAMTSDELYRVYKNRSWIWSDGGGYFRVSKREFTAWSKHGQKATTAKGVWYLPGQGKTCFRATWSSTEWLVGKKTCFEHRKDKKNIYQRKLPKGEWYIFKHTPVRSYDEVRKFKKGDHVGLKYTRNMELIEANRPDKCAKPATTLHRFLVCHFKK